MLPNYYFSTANIFVQEWETKNRRERELSP
jgi:hypothetical protein